MVVDPATRQAYAGQEDIGIWRIRADLTGKPVLVDKVREFRRPRRLRRGDQGRPAPKPATAVSGCGPMPRA
ncbi:hypothetical protein SAFG77S_04619 [Streptomyces afghaniensis]